MTDRPLVVVVGAGIAGLLAARELTRSFEVVVFDKGRGVGGRLATRRMGGATLDHGAQFMTADTPPFAERLAGWERAGIIQSWFEGRLGASTGARSDGRTRFRGVTSMNAIAKHLAAGLDVRTSTTVSTLEPAQTGWRIGLVDGPPLMAAGVVLTAPVPQASALLAAGSVPLAAADAAALDAIRYEPCLAVLAVLDGPSGLAAPGALHPTDGPISWLADNQVKGISAVPAVTVHATSDFSRTRGESSDAEVSAELLRSAGLASAPIEGQVQVQRWRYARPTVFHPESHLALEGLPPLVLAGDAFGGAKVEGAARSGLAAARAISELLARGAAHGSDDPATGVR